MDQDAGADMEPQVVAALVAGAVSLVVAGFSILSSRSNQRNVETLKGQLAAQADLRALENSKLIERLKAELEEGRASQNAWRDYVYEGSKRLYNHLEPLRFEFVTAADSAFARITDIARATRNGHLDGDDNWLDNPDEDYFLRSTIYRMLSPLAALRLAQEKLTLVDLGLDRQLQRWYILSRQASFTFSEDFFLAESAPAIQYNPDGGPVGGVADGSKHRRQGVYLGRLQNAVDALIHLDGDSRKVIRFGTFEQLYRDDARVATALAPVEYFFTGLHPGRRPVAWRILLAQAHLYRAITRLGLVGDDEEVDWRHVLQLRPEERAALDWRPGSILPGDEHGQVLDPSHGAVVEHLAVSLDHAALLHAESQRRAGS